MKRAIKSIAIEILGSEGISDKYDKRGDKKEIEKEIDRVSAGITKLLIKKLDEKEELDRENFQKILKEAVGEYTSKSKKKDNSKG